MSTLRDRKKQEVRLRIIETAERLFARDGLEEATIEGIAADAGVSAGTVYNYFGNKTTLPLACLNEDTTQMVEAGAIVLARPGKDPVKGVQRLIDRYITGFAKWDRRLLQEVFAASFRGDGGELTTELVQMDEKLLAQLTDLIGIFQTHGTIDSKVNPAEAALLLFSSLVTQIIMFISLEDSSPADLKRQVNRQVDLAFHGLAATNTKAK